MVNENFRTAQIDMKMYDYFSDSDVKQFESLNSFAINGLFFSLIFVKIAVLGIFCFNPIFTVLIKNIFVLEFCSMMILFNIKYSSQVFSLLKFLYDRVQGEIYPNLYNFEIERHSQFKNYRGNINQVGTQSYMLENSGIEINIILASLIAFCVFKILVNFKLKYRQKGATGMYEVIRNGLFYSSYSIVVKLFVALYGFFSFDYWIATLLDLGNFSRCATHHGLFSGGKGVDETEGYHLGSAAGLKILISSGSAFLLNWGWVYIMIYLKFHYNEQYLTKNSHKFSKIVK